MDDFMHWIVVLSLWMTSQTLCPYFLQSNCRQLTFASPKPLHTHTHTHSGGK